MSKKTVTRQHVTKSGDTWEWEETEETRAAIEKCTRLLQNLN